MSHRAADKHIYFTGPTVQVIVGADLDTPARSFFVHAELLTKRSKFFAKALKNYAERMAHPEGSETAAESDAQQADKAEKNAKSESIMWKEGEEGVVKLPIEVVENVWVVLAWKV